MTRVITLELPGEIYHQAEQVAQATHRPLEQIIVEWIQPPFEIELAETISDLEELNNEQLVQVARHVVPTETSRRLQGLLTLQQRRELTLGEQQQAADLVEREDLLTLQKARALFLLKQLSIHPPTD